MKAIKTVLLLALGFMVLSDRLEAYYYAEAMATVRVTDEKGRPVEGADTAIVFAVFDRWPGHAEGKRGMTGADGLFSFSARTHGEMRYDVRKKGYYDAEGSYRWGSSSRENGKYIPWNPVMEVTLKTIENPVPMYAKHAWAVLPQIGSQFGFDLEKGDWVEPYGKGKISDFLFKADRQGNTFENFKIRLEVTFSNKGDGIQSVIIPVYEDAILHTLRLPKLAPEEGYQEKWVTEIGNTPETGRYNLSGNKDQNFIFRVRTVLDENGKIKSANYGKIHDDFEIGGYSSKTLGIGFRYYFNPDGTRNLEFDPTRNLLKGIKTTEALTKP